INWPSSIGFAQSPIHTLQSVPSDVVLDSLRELIHDSVKLVVLFVPRIKEIQTRHLPRAIFHFSERFRYDAIWISKTMRSVSEHSQKGVLEILVRCFLKR